MNLYHRSLKLVPAVTCFLIIACCLFNTFVYKKKNKKPFTWAQTELWASPLLIGQSGTNGICEAKSVFPIKPCFSSWSRWVKLSLWSVHIISGKQDPKHDLRTRLRHVAPPEHILRNRPRPPYLSVFHIKMTLTLHQKCVSHSGLTVTDAPIQETPDFKWSLTSV